MKPKHLIFDFDGVIGDTYEATIFANMTANGLATREDAEAEIDEYFSKKPVHTRDHTQTDEQMAERYEWSMRFGLAMKECGFGLFEDFVEEVAKIDTPYLAIVSSGSQQYVLPAMADSPLEPTHILAYENHHSKEEKIETICKDWGVEPSDIYYFTDSLADVYELRDMIPKEKLIGVSWGFCSVETLGRELTPEQILMKPEDIHKLFA